MKLKNKEKQNVLEAYRERTEEIKNRIAPSRVYFHKDSTEVDRMIAKTFVVVDFPEAVRGNFLAPLYRFKGNLSISIFHETISSHKMQKALSNSIEENIAREGSSKSAIGRKRARMQIESDEELLDRLMQSSTEHAFNVFVYLHLQAKDQKEMERLERMLLNAMSRCGGLRAVEPIGNMMNGLKSMLPNGMNLIPEMTRRNFDPHAAAYLLPFDHSELFDEKGQIMGRNALTDSLIILDLEELQNRNIIILGKPGAGKTYALITWMLRDIASGNRVFAIEVDKKKEISKMLKRVGGSVIDIGVTSSTVINPMEIRYSHDPEIPDESADAFAMKLQFLETFFRFLYKDMSEFEAALLSEVIIELYGKRGMSSQVDWKNARYESREFPILSDLCVLIDDKYKEELARFRTVLKMYTEGSYKNLFNRHTEIDLDKQVVCISMSTLENGSAAQRAAVYMVFQYFWQEITNRKAKYTNMYMDEVHMFFSPDNPEAGKFLSEVSKVIRGLNGNLVTATQQAVDYFGTQVGSKNYGEALLSTSAIKLLLPMNDNDIKEIRDREIIKLSAEEERVLTSDQRGLGIFVAGHRHVQIQIEATKREAQIINPEKAKEVVRDVYHGIPTP